jgi:hypothetical protein
MRVFLIALLLLQALVAQAGVAGISCTHMQADSVERSAQAVVHGHSVLSEGHGPFKHNNSQPEERCCCDYAGHCSSAVDSSAFLTEAEPFPVVHSDSGIVDAVSNGFDRLPYRPPSYLS